MLLSHPTAFQGDHANRYIFVRRYAAVLYRVWFIPFHSLRRVPTFRVSAGRNYSKRTCTRKKISFVADKATRPCLACNDRFVAHFSHSAAVLSGKRLMRPSLRWLDKGSLFWSCGTINKDRNDYICFKGCRVQGQVVNDEQKGGRRRVQLGVRYSVFLCSAFAANAFVG